MIGDWDEGWCGRMGGWEGGRVEREREGEGEGVGMMFVCWMNG